MKLFKLFMMLVVIVATIILAVSLLVRYQLSPVPDAASVVIQIETGMSPRAAVEMMEENHVIRDATFFYLWMKYFDEPNLIQAGRYIVDTPIDKTDLMVKLKSGGDHKESIRVTIPEGLKVEETIDILVSHHLGERQKYLDLCRTPIDGYDFLPENYSEHVFYPLEGYLYPDTYDFFTDATEEQVIEKLLARFNVVYSTDYRDRARELGLSDFQIVTMASIVEKEAKLENERPMIAGVFYNRMQIGMAFQSCATIQFLFEEPKERLLNIDLEIDSPYNTYQTVGLPPGPIASPGKKSLEAALWPEDHEYLYFVANEDGSHQFNETYAGHLEDKND